ncbi:MAG: ribonuclease III [Synechococcales bacterium]|nr:ribonuclease III [Synechococcales bacterium]
MVKRFQLPAFQQQHGFQRAMTHRSYANEQGTGAPDNDRLEFLGDAVLNFLCGEFLYQRYPDLPEGKLTIARSALIEEKQLAQFAIALNLGQYLRLGKGAENDRARTNAYVLSCTFEALIGAYYLDTGSDMVKVRDYLTPFLEGVVEQVLQQSQQANYKSELQHWANVHHQENPDYTVVGARGPDHNKEFIVEVSILGKKYGIGMGRTKQAAQKEAAKNALERLAGEGQLKTSTQ